ncbi:MAG: sugar kinase [Dorea sp.]|jgi:sugar/nucleoside kinase (ribokinase family)|nr:sugar kinase [Dorea sp.]
MEAGKPEVLLIGAAIIDVLVRPAEEKVFQTGSYPAEDIRMSVGGDAQNEATVLARMGMAVRLSTVIGNDQAGSFLLEHCRREGIRLFEGCVRDGMATGINVVLVGEDGRRNFLTNAQGSLRKLCLGDIRMPFPESVKIVCFASIFVFPQIGVRELEHIFAQAKRQNKIVCADMTKCKNGETVEEMAEAFSYIDYLLPNDEEAMILTGMDTAFSAAEELLRTGVGNVVVKCGKAGCLVMNREESYMVPGKSGIECVDTTGAGDSFVAGFIFALSKGCTLRECAEFGNECGARAVAVTGATEWLKIP